TRRGARFVEHFEISIGFLEPGGESVRHRLIKLRLIPPSGAALIAVRQDREIESDLVLLPETVVDAGLRNVGPSASRRAAVGVPPAAFVHERREAFGLVGQRAHRMPGPKFPNSKWRIIRGLARVR